jgi:hypothetical protein
MFERISYATRSMVSRNVLSLPAYVRGLTKVLNRVHPPTAAGKPSKPRVTTNQLSVAITPPTSVPTHPPTPHNSPGLFNSPTHHPHPPTRLFILTPLIAGLAILFSASAARAENTPPRWVITSTSDPTNIKPNSPSTEVLDITIDATGGTFTLDASGIEDKTKPIPYDASPEEVHMALEEADVHVGGAVTVTGGPEGGVLKPYVVTYSADQFFYQTSSVGVEELITADSSGLTGGAQTATVSVVSQGAGNPTLTVIAINVGGSATDGGPVTISDTLPAGLSAIGASGLDAYRREESKADGEAQCALSPVLECTFSGVPVDPGDQLVVNISLTVAGPPEVSEGTSVVNRANVAGGGAAPAFANGAGGSPITISSSSAAYGIVPGSLVSALSSTQAGAHANDTTAFTLNTGRYEQPAADPKDIEFDAPVGLVGDAVTMPRCTPKGVFEGTCPPDSMVGTATLSVYVCIVACDLYGAQAETSGVYNIAPAPGEPAAFEFEAGSFRAAVRLDASVLSAGDYGVRVTAPNLNENGNDVYSAVTLWGTPSEHNGPGPDKTEHEYIAGGPGFGGPGTGERVAFLSNPTQCSEPVSGTLLTDSWSAPGAFVPGESELLQPGFGDPASSGTLTGCNALPFSTAASMVPDTFQAGAPAGYDFNLEVHRSGDKPPEGDAAPDVKSVVTTLPLGTVISPSAANGLTACKDDPGVNPAEVTNEFGLHSLSLASCADSSQIGTVQITSPDIAESFGGAVYLAEPECNPCTPADAENGTMVKLLLQAKGEGEAGVLVKLKGTGSVNQQTGQITTTFANNPQLPFSDFKLSLGGGPRASLANPRTCGPATTNIDLTPWTTPFEPESDDPSTYQVSGCPGAQFAPSFFAGTTSNQAGGFTPFTLSFGRTDADQYLAGIQLKTPPGLVGSLANVPLCPEPQASQGTCSPTSEIGTSQVLTGPGAEPFLVTGGKVFLTGPYKGAPFGLSVVVPAKAGPYTLSGTTGTGNVVVRSTINIDPTTSALTVTSDPLPTILDGIPLQLKLVNVTIDRPDFMFNPTSCNKMGITGTLSSAEGASAAVSSSFQVTNCEALKFQPKFTVSTSGKTSKADGASLDTKVTYPNVPQGTDADIAKVKVELPKQLPSRLTTLQKACTAAQFNANPAGCPEASIIGIVRVNTPVLPVPAPGTGPNLTGPVYFVSNGGEAFPNLIMVLQGDGVRVNVVGDTFISKSGITSTTFKTLPDVPFSSFELYLPEGKFSALAANGNLCKSKLAMPNEFIAQNGAAIHESTAIAVTGCPKPKKAVKKKKKAKKASKARKSTNGRRAQS